MHDTFRETPTRIDSPDGAAWGVVCLPTDAEPAADVGVVFVQGGFQYRAGSHRQTVRLARRLASVGVPSLRFDLAGLGDATGEMHNFEHLSPQIQAATDTLSQQAPAVKRVVLWGLCDGASAALLYWEQTRDARIHGLALVNPWVRSESSLARTHVRHYYLRRLQDKAFWQKLLRGGVGTKAVGELLSNLRLAQRSKRAPVASFQERMAKAWREFQGDMLLVISEADITGQEFIDTLQQDPKWTGCLDTPRLNHISLPHADHTNSTPAADQQLMQETCSWLTQLRQRLTSRPA